MGGARLGLSKFIGGGAEAEMGVAYLTLSKLLPAFRAWAQYTLIIMSSSHLRPVQLVVSDS